MSKNILLVLIAGLMMSFTCESQAQFITLARKIKSINSGNKDVATVILDAGTTKVYRAVADTLASDPTCKIIKRDDVKKLVQFSHDPYTLTIQVDSMAAGVSQITVLAENQGKSTQNTSDKAANVILAVCKKVGLHCTLK